MLTAYWVIGQSDPLGPPGLFLPAACCVYYILLPLLFANFALRACVTVLAPRNHDAEPEPQLRGRWRWVIVPACTLLCVWVTVDNWPLMWRFRASHAALQAEVARLASAAPRNPKKPQHDFYSCPGWRGLYHIQFARVRRDPDGIVQSIEFCTGGFMIGAWGFRYDFARPGTSFEPELPAGWSRWARD